MKNKILPCLFFLIIFQHLFFILFFPPIIEGDSNLYITLAQKIISNYEFDNNIRLPGYPIFLAAIYKIFGQSNLAVIIFQHLLGIIVYLLMIKILPSEKYRIVFSILYFFDLLYNSYQHAILANSLFSFLLCVSAYFIWLYQRNSKYIYLLLCGLFVALGIFVKPVLKFFPYFAILLFFINKQNIKNKLVSGIFFIIFPLLFVNLWGLKNYLQKGYFSLLPFESFHYIGRIVNYMEFPENSISKETFLKYIKLKPIPRKFKSSVVYSTIAELKKEKKLSELEMDSELKRIFKTSILKHPFIYTKENFIELFYFFFSAHNLYAKYSLQGKIPFSVTEGIHNKKILPILLKVLVSMHPFYWLVFFLSVYFVVSNIRKIFIDKDIFSLYIIGVIIYISAITCMANEGLAAYRGDIHPFMIFIATFSIMKLISKNRRKLL